METDLKKPQSIAQMDNMEGYLASEILSIERDIEIDEVEEKKEKKKLSMIEQTLKDHKNLLAKKKELIKKVKEKKDKEKQLDESKEMKEKKDAVKAALEEVKKAE